MIDAHIHIEQYDERILEVSIERWRESGIEGVIAVSNDLPSSYRTLELQSRFPEFVHAAVGFHPERPLPTESHFLEWEKLVAVEKQKIVAIGEVGLPHYNLTSLPASLEHYTDLLSRCIDVGTRHQLPIALHAVHDKAALVLAMLKLRKIKNAHFHWLKAPLEVVVDIVKADYYISVTPEVCYRVRDQFLTKHIPITQLLIETDGPWPYSGQFKNQPTTPLHLLPMIKKLSDLYKVEDDEVIHATRNNTNKCYLIQ